MATPRPRPSPDARGAYADVYVGLGANLGDRIGALREAVRALGAWPATGLDATSAVYETEAHVRPGAPPQPDHLNAVVRLRTALAPREVLRRLHDAERAAGRAPDAAPWSPRPLDLDLLLYADLVLAAPGITVPHPRIAERRFVLVPLAELAPALAVPGADRTVRDLLDATPDAAAVERTPFPLRLAGGG